MPKMYSESDEPCCKLLNHSGELNNSNLGRFG